MMLTLLLAIAAASQRDMPAGHEPKATPAQYTAADYCADYGDYAFVIMEDVRKGRDAGSMLIDAQNTGANEEMREVLTGLVMNAFEFNRITRGTMTPKRFADELTLACFNEIKEKERVSSKNP